MNRLKQLIAGTWLSPLFYQPVDALEADIHQSTELCCMKAHPRPQCVVCMVLRPGSYGPPLDTMACVQWYGSAGGERATGRELGTLKSQSQWRQGLGRCICTEWLSQRPCRGRGCGSRLYCVCLPVCASVCLCVCV